MALDIAEINSESCKGYLIACEAAGEAAVVDPVFEMVDRIVSVLARRHLRLRYVIDTHTHADHRTGSRALAAKCGAQIVMHRRAPTPTVDRYVDDGDELALGEDAVRVIETPGHTPDAISLIVPAAWLVKAPGAESDSRSVPAVLTGDTLLIAGTGRTDLPGGDAGAQFDSLHKKLLALPDHTIVLPGHDYRGRERSTIGDERRTNPRLQVKDRDAYVALMRGLNLPLPAKIQEALQANQSALDPERFSFPETGALAAVRELAVAEAFVLIARGELFALDVREPAERTGELGYIEGSLHIPLRTLPERAALELRSADTIVAVCRSGCRSATAAALLTGLGYPRVFNLTGGMLAWVAASLPVDRRQTEGW